MKSNYKHKLTSLAIFLSFGIYIFFGFKFFNKINIDLENVSSFSGEVENIEVKKMGTRAMQKALSIKLIGLSENLWLLKHNNNYKKYLSEIQNGNIIKVYYLDNDIIQIEKNTKIIVDKTEFKNEQKRNLWIIIFVTIFTLIISVFHFKEN